MVDNAERMLDLIISDWKSLIIVVLLLIFVLPELWKRIDEIKNRIGIITKQERRFLALETKQTELIAENQRLKTEISEAEKRCKDTIENTEKKFDDREYEHWEESKAIKGNMDSKLDMIIQKLEKQESLDFKNLRHSIVKAGESYVNRGSVKIRELRSLEELYEEYTDTYDGNSYVETLMTKVRALDVIGRLNEHGEDIE